MMRGSQLAMAGGPQPVRQWVEFQPNGTSDPSLTAMVGPLKAYVSTCTYSATGGYVFTFTTDMWPAAQFGVSCMFNTLANWIEVGIDAAYNATTRQLTVRAHRSGTGNAVAASTNARILLWAEANLSRA